MACYVVNTSASDDSGKKKCSPVLEDYYECLHHKKEVRFCLGGSKMCARQRGRGVLTAGRSMRERWRYKLRMPELNQRRLETMRRARARSGTLGFWGRRRTQKRCLGRIEAMDTAWASIFSA